MHSLCGMSTKVYITCFSITEVKKLHIILGIHCRQQEKDLPNPLTSSIFLAGVELPAGVEVSDPSMKAQGTFYIPVHTYINHVVHSVILVACV